MKKIIGVVVWVALAVFNYGTINAEWGYTERHEFVTLHESQRDNIGFMLSQSAIIPPIEFFTSAFLSNFWQHGWDLTSKPWEETK